MWQLPGKNIAFVFSDAAGANACLALSKIRKKENNISAKLFSNKKCAGQEFKDVEIITEVPSFKKLGIDCVFTGTSHPESSQSFEVNCIRTAVKEKIYTVSFIDHWVNFKLRFSGLHHSEYPNEIWVVDEKARQLAIDEGLPADKLKVTLNPYHYYLQHFWKPSYTDKNYFEELKIPTTGHHILFAPDPLSLRNEEMAAGFSEQEALQDIISVLPGLQKEAYLVVKCHPLQPVENLQAIAQKNKNCFVIKDADPLELAYAADLVIGFYSNLLLEARAIGKKVIRYFPGNEEADLLKHNSQLKKVTDTTVLAKEIKFCLYE